MDPTPESLPRIIHYNCKMERTTNRCSFVKYGIPCTLEADEEQSVNQNSEFSVEA